MIADYLQYHWPVCSIVASCMSDGLYIKLRACDLLVFSCLSILLSCFVKDFFHLWHEAETHFHNV